MSWISCTSYLTLSDDMSMTHLAGSIVVAGTIAVGSAGTARDGVAASTASTSGLTVCIAGTARDGAAAFVASPNDTGSTAEETPLSNATASAASTSIASGRGG